MAHFSAALRAAAKFKRSIGTALIATCVRKPGKTRGAGIRPWLSIVNADPSKWLGKVEDSGRSSVELISDFLDGRVEARVGAHGPVILH
jgi:hypothetical protein